jgi:hypothetical protein
MKETFPSKPSFIIKEAYEVTLSYGCQGIVSIDTNQTFSSRCLQLNLVPMQ